MKRTLTIVLAASALAACETAGPSGPPPPERPSGPAYIPPSAGGAEAFRDSDFAWSTGSGGGAIQGVLAFKGPSGHYTCQDVCQSPDVRREQGEAPRLTQNGSLMQQFLNLSSFAEQMLIHQHACVAIRKDMPLDRAALIGCGVMTGVGAVIHTSNVRPGETVAVIGCGGVGLAAINGAAIAGAGRVIAIDLSPGKDNMARTFGATDFICAADTDPVKTVMEMTGGGVHHSFEAIGLGKTAEQAFNMLRRGGTANVIGMIPIGQTVTLMGAAFLGEKRIQGSLMGSNRFPVDMPRLVDFYMSGKLKLDDMISRRIKLEDVNDAFSEMKSGQIARSVIVFN
jgi:S-(hydroxymethyl)glutathione dehydrogenase/alcohol dehydrogenase